MENKKENERGIKEQIDKLTSPIFNKVLQETPLNHTMVVKPRKKNVTPALYNPHNYRLYLPFTKSNFKPVQGMVGVWFGKFKNYGKEFTALGEGIRVTIKKTQAELINKLSEEEWFYINKAKAREEISALLNKIDKKCLDSFKRFIEIYGGVSDFMILKREGRPNLNLFTECDNKVMQEPFIDSLPLGLTFETDIVKKPYKEPNVEFKKAIYAANYLENSALNEFSPEIANSISSLAKSVTDVNNALNPAIMQLKEQITLHLAVQREQLKNQKTMNKLLKRLDNRFSQESLKRWL